MTAEPVRFREWRGRSNRLPGVEVDEQHMPLAEAQEILDLPLDGSWLVYHRFLISADQWQVNKRTARMRAAAALVKHRLAVVAQRREPGGAIAYLIKRSAR